MARKPFFDVIFLFAVLGFVGHRGFAIVLVHAFVGALLSVWCEMERVDAYMDGLPSDPVATIKNIFTDMENEMLGVQDCWVLLCPLSGGQEIRAFCPA